jgi:hypothetical protein
MRATTRPRPALMPWPSSPGGIWSAPTCDRIGMMAERPRRPIDLGKCQQASCETRTDRRPHPAFKWLGIIRINA